MSGPDAIAPPVFLWDPDTSDLLAFASAEEAARHLAPWQEVGAVAAYDARGRRVTFALGRRPVPLLRLFRVTREAVVVAGVEREPSHADDLRRALVAALERRGADPAALASAALGELAGRAARALGRPEAPPRRTP